MKIIELNRIPFGVFHAVVDHISAVVPAYNDPFMMPLGQEYGCLVLLGGEEFRVKESTQEVLALIQGNPAPEPHVMVTAPVITKSTKKVTKSGYKS